MLDQQRSLTHSAVSEAERFLVGKHGPCAEREKKKQPPFKILHTAKLSLASKTKLQSFKVCKVSEYLPFTDPHGKDYQRTYFSKKKSEHQGLEWRVNKESSN